MHNGIKICEINRISLCNKICWRFTDCMENFHYFLMQIRFYCVQAFLQIGIDQQLLVGVCHIQF